MRIRFTFQTLFVIAAAIAAVAVAALVFFLLPGRPPAPPSIVPERWPTVLSTVAGVGAPGLAEGRGHEAAFSDPFGIAIDGLGNTYLADAGDNNVIWRIDPTGRATIVAGGREGFSDGDGRAAAFNTPSAIAFEPAGSLVVADTGNNAIRRVSPAGVVTTIAGGGEPTRVDGPAHDARFNGPVGVAVARDGAVIVADTYNDCIRRIARDGQVTTIAGGGGPGYLDGPAPAALFDTPSGVAVNEVGDIYVADTGNDAVRLVSSDGLVTTVGRAGSGSAVWQFVDLFRPVGIAVKHDIIYVTDGAGRVLAWPRGREVRVLAERGDRLRDPTGIDVAPDGSIRVADSDNYLLCRLTRPGDPVPSADIDFTPVPWLTPATLHVSALPWPVDPQHAWHEIAATIGEARGSLGGDARERLHTGIDVRAPIGTIVRAVHDEKVERPTAATGFGSANESIRIDVVSYVHVRIGRTRRGKPLDPSRFTIVRDDTGHPVRVRVRRGTRFQVGDVIGTVNNFAHVHLGVGPREGEINPLSLSLDGFRDDIAPEIAPRGITLYAENTARIDPPRKGPVVVSGRVSIVVEAYDRVNGNDAKRKLGVYRLGYQVLTADGRPAPGFGQPLVTIEFDRLPAAHDAPQLIYAEGSGITVYGSKTTRFRYILTNSLIEGRVTQGYWDTAQLPAGDYRLRVFAEDFSGNRAARDLPVRVQ